MSSTSTFTLYSIQGNIGSSASTDNITINLTSYSGATDASAIALIEAIQNLAWPEGVTCSLLLLKTATDQINSQADLTAVPPAFV